MFPMSSLVVLVRAHEECFRQARLDEGDQKLNVIRAILHYHSPCRSVIPPTPFS
jgi:hypothetical protein